METMYFHSAPSKKGRVTVAGVVEDGKLKLGASKCSKYDFFVKKRGRDISKGRALSHVSTIGAISIDRRPKVYGNAILSYGMWFKLLAQEVVRLVQKGKLNPRHPNHQTV